MGGKTAIGGGLVAGLVTGAIVVGAVVLLAPGPGAPDPAASPEPVAQASASPSVSASTSPSASDGSSPGASGSPGASVDPGAAFGIGEPAPPLAVPQLGGGEIALSNLRGTPVWVNFMASWCPPCRDELPIMNGYAARYADTGLVVLAIDVREDEAVVDAFVRELNVTFPVGLDGDGTAQSDWGAFALPVHYWIDAEGIVRDGALGGIGPDVMAEGLESILPGVEVTP
jgi:cytochrome c biogenesis protein CcmG, thiol:disulfide interchange protein DsbE